MDIAFTTDNDPLVIDGAVYTPGGSDTITLVRDPETGRFVPVPLEEAKPKGMATIVQDDPLDIFPNENDNPSEQPPTD